ncbi:hypothetical protein TeGR_g14953, partial [Tetraparma gracilis]
MPRKPASTKMGALVAAALPAPSTLMTSEGVPRPSSVTSTNAHSGALPAPPPFPAGWLYSAAFSLRRDLSAGGKRQFKTALAFHHGGADYRSLKAVREALPGLDLGEAQLGPLRAQVKELREELVPQIGAAGPSTTFVWPRQGAFVKVRYDDLGWCFGEVLAVDARKSLLHVQYLGEPQPTGEPCPPPVLGDIQVVSREEFRKSKRMPLLRLDPATLERARFEDRAEAAEKTPTVKQRKLRGDDGAAKQGGYLWFADDPEGREAMQAAEAKAKVGAAKESGGQGAGGKTHGECKDDPAFPWKPGSARSLFNHKNWNDEAGVGEQARLNREWARLGDKERRAYERDAERAATRYKERVANYTPSSTEFTSR